VIKLRSATCNDHRLAKYALDLRTANECHKRGHLTKKHDSRIRSKETRSEQAADGAGVRWICLRVRSAKESQRFDAEGRFSQSARRCPRLNPNSIAWEVLRNPISLLIGGITAVLLELGEPRVREGAGALHFSHGSALAHAALCWSSM